MPSLPSGLGRGGVGGTGSEIVGVKSSVGVTVGSGVTEVESVEMFPESERVSGIVEDAEVENVELNE